MFVLHGICTCINVDRQTNTHLETKSNNHIWIIEMVGKGL
jgi:hypothetical protein